jgi:hypothetical protein
MAVLPQRAAQYTYAPYMRHGRSIPVTVQHVDRAGEGYDATTDQCHHDIIIVVQNVRIACSDQPDSGVAWTDACRVPIVNKLRLERIRRIVHLERRRSSDIHTLQRSTERSLKWPSLGLQTRKRARHGQVQMPSV